MLNALKFKNSDASAKVVDGKLILSFPHAITPVVWQMDLKEVKASALEVLNNEETNEFTLTLKTPKGEKIEAAKFDTREKAVEGLMAASNALQDAQGCIQATQIAANEDQAVAVTTHTKSKPKKGHWVAGILGVLLLLILINVWGGIAPRPPESFNSAANTAAVSPQNAANSAGVPVSADAFLNSL